MQGEAVRIRLPAWLRVYSAVFGVVWCGIVGSAAIALAVGGHLAALVPAAMLVIGGLIGYRTFRLSVQAHADELVVRNSLRSLTLRRNDIEEFRIGGPASFGKSIHVLLVDGDLLPLEVTTTLGLLGRGRARQQEQLRSLQRWHDPASG